MIIGRKPNKLKSRQSRTTLLGVLRKNIVLRAVLVIFTVILTLILLFALTVAWYTNVVQSGGLTFTAQQWDFSGTVNIPDINPEAYPGAEGVIPMELINEGTQPLSATVTVAKNQLDREMQQRMYFYVDTTSVRGGELIDRVWVDSLNGYNYTVFPESQLQISETTQSVPALKWTWVYDVLGYYVRGTASSGTVMVQEYIRPVEYDYDPVYTTFDSGVGYPVKINQNTTVEAFLEKLTANDGYPGKLTASAQRNDGGYYAIDVDENGYGVWLYLCTYTEIQNHTAYDNQLAAGKPINGQVVINVTGQNGKAEYTQIGTAQALINALNDPNAGIVKLTNDVTIDAPLNLTTTTTAMLDLNGHTITSTANAIIYGDPGDTITVYNGTLTGNGQEASMGVYSSGANITLHNVTIQNVDEGIQVFDHKNNLGADSGIHLIDCTIRAAMDGLWIYGNGDASQRKTKIVIENSTIVGESYAGVICNGSTTNSGTEIQIIGGNISGYYTGIYNPGKDSLLTANGATISGMTGLVAKGGTIELINCQVKGTGTKDDLQEPSLNVSGWSDTGDGVYLEASYEWQTIVLISGADTNITSNYAEAVRKYKEDSANAHIIVSGGTFSSDVSRYLIEGAICTDEDADGMYTVKLNQDQISGEYTAISTPQALINALNDPDAGVVKLADDITLDQPLDLTNATNASLDLNGKTLTSTASKIIVGDPGDTITISNGHLVGNNQSASTGIYSSGATVTLNNVTLSNVEEGVQIFDHENNRSAVSKIHLVNCTINGSEDGLWIYGNGGDEDRKTEIVIENSTITGAGYAGIICNGSESNKGTSIQIIGGSVSGYYTGIYNPGKDSILTANGTSITGMTGLVAKGGMVELINCKIYGNGAKESLQEPSLVISGWSDTGDGVYLEASYEWSTVISISGADTEIISANALAVRMYTDDSPNGKIEISGGNFSNDVSRYLADGAKCTDADGDGLYTVK